MGNSIDRRNFIQKTIGISLAIAGTNLLSGCENYDSKGLPTCILGKTGVKIPRIAMGLGSRFCTIKDPEESEAILNYALDNGLYYWDTAWIYNNKITGVISEERVGQVIKYRRKEVFLSTKVTSRDPKEAMNQIETSLKRLNTDKLDMLKIHGVASIEDVDTIGAKGGVYEIVSRLKEEGVTRFIGFSGHDDAKAMKTMVERYDFDSMLVAMNHYIEYEQQYNRQDIVIPVANERGIGIMVMKAVRPRENDKRLNPLDLIRYALSLKDVNGAVIGIDSMDVLNANLDLLHNFRPMTELEMYQMTANLRPFFNYENIPWMKKGYCDGNWA